MSALLAVIDHAGLLPDDRTVDRMLVQMRPRGSDLIQIWKGRNAVLAVARADWEMGDGFSEEALVVQDGSLVLIADASIYYRDDLRRSLLRQGVRPAGHSPSHLILAAYRAWGVRCGEHLEGDFAFVLWDATKNLLFSARDFGGKRTLYYAQFQGTLVVASSIGAVLQHPKCPRDLNLASIAETAAGLWGSSSETCYRSVFTVPAAYNLEWNGAGTPAVSRHWQVPATKSANTSSFEMAAEELRGLLAGAVSERMAPTGPTAIWLSGGWDSTAVFAAGRKLMMDQRTDGCLQPISVSYPPGDPGREDELIREVAGYWSVPVRWVNVDDIPVFDQPERRAAERDTPFAHAYEMFNRTLASETGKIGARVAFDGSGGDQLFASTDAFLLDLFSKGRWTRLVREWREMGYPTGRRGSRLFLHSVLKPLLPWYIRRLIGRSRGGSPLQGRFEKRVPSWIQPKFAEQHELLQREVRYAPLRVGSWTEYEMHWFVDNAFFPRTFAMIFDYAQMEGVEHRSPLYDRRIVEFAATRPREERRYGKESKRLLRQSMRGLLPDGVLAPRSRRTGLSNAYFERAMRKQFGELLERVNNCSVLEELGIVDSTRLSGAWDNFLRSGARSMLLPLFFTLQTELWLRGRGC